MIYYRNNSDKTFTIHNNLLAVRYNNQFSFLPIPYGLALNSHNELESIEEGGYIIRNTNKINDDFTKEIAVKENLISYKVDNKEISLVYNTLDYASALKILQEEHYLSNIPSGLIIILKINDEVAGVIIFNKLTYSIPKGRRSFLGEDHKIIEDTEIREFSKNHIGWISRIALKKEYQSAGNGTFFLQNFTQLLASIYQNSQLSYIEVLTSWSLEDFTKKTALEGKVINDMILPEGDDLFIRSGYTRINLSDKREDGGEIRRIQRKIFSGNRIETKLEKVIQYYYVKQI